MCAWVGLGEGGCRNEMKLHGCLGSKMGTKQCGLSGEVNSTHNSKAVQHREHTYGALPSNGSCMVSCPTQSNLSLNLVKKLSEVAWSGGEARFMVALPTHAPVE